MTSPCAPIWSAAGTEYPHAACLAQRRNDARRGLIFLSIFVGRELYLQSRCERSHGLRTEVTHLTQCSRASQSSVMGLTVAALAPAHNSSTGYKVEHRTPRGNPRAVDTRSPRSTA